MGVSILEDGELQPPCKAIVFVFMYVRLAQVLTGISCCEAYTCHSDLANTVHPIV